MSINIISNTSRTYDAIVIGSGASGGWAAKELCDKGLKTLVLERGFSVEHSKDYPTASKGPWDFKFRGEVPIDERLDYYDDRPLRAETKHWFIKKNEQPVVEEKPFGWFRSYHTGGKSLMWARQTQRLGDLDFTGPVRDGFAIDWPIRHKDLDPWYTHVEKFVGISGSRDGLAELPDSYVMRPFELNCVEKHFQQVLKAEYAGKRPIIHGRVANMTEPGQIHFDQGRSRCQNQTQCNRGCHFGGYFSSNSSTLPWAMKTGNMTLRPDSVVHSIIYDEKAGKASGVRVVDAHSKEMIEFYAKIIFVNGSTVNSVAILMNSTSARFPNGLGNDNGLLGKNLIWHNFRGKASAQFAGMSDKMVSGRSPTNAYLPRFRNLYNQETDFLRGYASGIAAGRSLNPQDTSNIGADLTHSLLNPQYNNWYISSWMMGEVIPLERNHMRLHQTLRDQYDIAQIVFSCEWTDNDEKMLKDYGEQTTEMFEKAGFTNINIIDTKRPPGSEVHEMGGARMGDDPATSQLNRWNQVHQCPNVFVTDGACMVSSATQNPTLTYMALTARAANYAVDELNKRNLG